MRDEGGFTLIEVTVTLAIMSVVMLLAFGFLDQITNVSSRTQNDVNTENSARLALRAITEDIRAAQPSTISFTGPTSTCPSPASANTCITFTIIRDTQANPNCQSVITYGLLSSAIAESRTDSGCVKNPTMSGRTVISSIANGSTALFTYYDKNGALLTSGQASAASVGVTMKVQYQTNSPVLTFSGYASLRNAR